MARRTEDRLLKLERVIQQSPTKRFEAMDLDGIRRRVCADFGITAEQLDGELDQTIEDGSRPGPAAEAYWNAYGAAMRRVGLTFVDLMEFARQEATA